MTQVAVAVEPAGADPREGASTARARLVLGLVSLLALLLGLLGLAVGPDGLRVVALLVFCTVGVGSAPWQLNRSLDLTERLLFTGVTSLAVSTFGSLAMEEAGWWRPGLAAGIVAALCLPLHVAGLVRARAELAAPSAVGAPAPPGAAAPAVRTRVPVSLVLAGIGLLLSLGAALVARPVEPGFWGYLPDVGVAWFLGLTAVLVALVLARAAHERDMAISVVALLLVLTVTPALVYAGPRSQSTTKHVDLIAQVLEGRLQAAVEVYNSWPGFFTSNAWLSDVVGIGDVQVLAVAWPPLIGLLRLVALRYLAGQLLASPFQRWVAVALAVLADAIGADYFSPQSVGFVLGVAAFGLALRPGRAPLHRWVLLLIGCTVAVTHQLSPFVIGGVLVLLVIFRQVRPWWTPVLVLGPAVAWTLLHFDSVRQFLFSDAVGELANFRPPQTVASGELERLPIVTYSVVALVGGILLVGLLALVTLVRDRRSLRTWAVAVCPSVGLALVAVNPYGQEGIFRATLFALPWLAVLAARCFPDRPGPRARASLFAATAFLGVTFLVATTALDAFTVTRPADVAAVEYAHERSQDDYFFVPLGRGDLPDLMRVGPAAARLEDVLVGDGADPADMTPTETVDRLTLIVGTQVLPSWEGPAPDVYVTWSPVQSAYMSAYGLQRPEDFAALRDAVQASPYWDLVLEQDGTELYQFDASQFAADAP